MSAKSVSIREYETIRRAIGQYVEAGRRGKSGGQAPKGRYAAVKAAMLKGLGRVWLNCSTTLNLLFTNMFLSVKDGGQ